MRNKITHIGLFVVENDPLLNICVGKECEPVPSIADVSAITSFQHLYMFKFMTLTQPFQKHYISTALTIFW